MKDVKKTIKELLCEVTDNSYTPESIKDSTDIINDIGLDSIQMINFILMIEDEFEIEIDFEDFDYDNLKSIDSLSNFVTSLINCISVN